MRSVKLKEVSPGMVLSADVKDRTGRTIVSTGKKLTEKHIKILKAWGIPAIKVESPKKGDGEMEIPPSLEKGPVPDNIKKEMLELFRHTDSRHPAVRELFNLCSLRKMNPDG